MAQINIQKKKSNLWPWIILILIIVAAILFFMFMQNDGRESDTVLFSDTTQSEGQYRDDVEAESNMPGNRLTAFGQFAHDTSAAGEDIKEYASEGIRHLALAAEEIAEDRDLAKDRVTALSDSLETMADNIEDKGTSSIKSALDRSVELISSLNPQNNEQISELDKIASRISPEGRYAKQDLQQFFTRSSDILMNIINQDNTISTK